MILLRKFFTSTTNTKFDNVPALCDHQIRQAKEPFSPPSPSKLQQEYNRRPLVTLSIPFPDLESGSILFTLPIETDNTPCQIYAAEELSVRNQDGPVILTKHTSPSTGDQEWLINEPLKSGVVTLQCLAKPRDLNFSTNCGTRVDLRSEDTGIQGCGCSFIPLPPKNADRKYRFSVGWDVSELPEDTRCIWTFAESPGTVEVEGDLDYYIAGAQFMVGQVQSYPPKSEGDSRFSFYCFGDDTPSKVAVLGPINESLFANMSNLFEKGIEEKEPYRVFVRKSVFRQAFGGTALSRSYVLENGDDVEEIHPNEILFLLSHEMVHNWLLMSSEEDGEGENRWYNEGSSRDLYKIALHQ
jgi:hypothetical protein